MRSDASELRTGDGSISKHEVIANQLYRPQHPHAQKDGHRYGTALVPTRHLDRKYTCDIWICISPLSR
jgi:hypothetical protein